MSSSRLTIGISLKLYFDRRETLSWCSEVADLARAHEGLSVGLVEVFVLPSAPMLSHAVEIFADSPVSVGAQDLWIEDTGAFTGEVSGTMLADLGCKYAEVGHAERRALFGEDDLMVGGKVRAAVRNGLTPVLCIGESEEGSAEAAAASCLQELDSVLEAAAWDDSSALIVAYEPVWAIGQSVPAPPRHINVVTDALRDSLARRPGANATTVIYGGSARLGLLGEISGTVDGLFLGRFAHNPRVLGSILDEATDVAKMR